MIQRATHLHNLERNQNVERSVTQPRKPERKLEGVSGRGEVVAGASYAMLPEVCVPCPELVSF